MKQNSKIVNQTNELNYRGRTDGRFQATKES